MSDKSSVYSTEGRLGCRNEVLPPKFTDQEREAYVWLWDCGETGWLVDLAKKTVTTASHGDFESLVDYRKFIERSVNHE